MKIAESVLELMQSTPLVALKGRECSKPRAKVWAKLELALPGQMKDRVALQMVEDAEKRGWLQPGGVIVESSSGTLAEGLARVSAVKGYKLIIVTDPRLDRVSAAKLQALGAQLEFVTDYHPSGGWQYSRLARLKEILRANPGAFWPRQYDNPSNPGAYDALADELLDALHNNIAALIGPVGSGGSLCGTAARLRVRIPDLRVIAVDAVGSVQFRQPNLSRLQSGHGNSIIPGNLQYQLIDEVHWINDGEAFAACRELARREGIFAGGSSGAAYIVASWAAACFSQGQQVVVLFPDRGDRYAESIYSDDYLRKHRLSGIAAGEQPVRIRYGVDFADKWSFAQLPRDGSEPYYDPDCMCSKALAQILGI